MSAVMGSPGGGSAMTTQLTHFSAGSKGVKVFGKRVVGELSDSEELLEQILMRGDDEEKEGDGVREA